MLKKIKYHLLKKKKHFIVYVNRTSNETAPAFLGVREPKGQEHPHILKKC